MSARDWRYWPRSPLGSSSVNCSLVDRRIDGTSSTQSQTGLASRATPQTERVPLGDAETTQFNALAGLVAIFGLIMLSLAVFFVLAPYWGQALAALTVGGIDLVLAVVLVIYAGSLKPTGETEMVKEVRNMALSDIEEEIALAETEFVAPKDDVHKFIRNPLDTLLPVAIAPLLSAVIGGLGSAKK